MAQKEVEDIFAKTMHKDKFKRATSVGLAKSFLSNLTQVERRGGKVGKQATKITEEEGSSSESASEGKSNL